ncbi:MAG: hypothetical protein IKG82_10920 [Oscillospiraceae bacterium]|nr:hypothetical protein [Oscillospiraceae bacterium]
MMNATDAIGAKVERGEKMTQDERRAIIEEIMGYLRQLGLVRPDDKEQSSDS